MILQTIHDKQEISILGKKYQEDFHQYWEIDLQNQMKIKKLFHRDATKFYDQAVSENLSYDEINFKKNNNLRNVLITTDNSDEK